MRYKLSVLIGEIEIEDVIFVASTYTFIYLVLEPPFQVYIYVNINGVGILGLLRPLKVNVERLDDNIK